VGSLPVQVIGADDVAFGVHCEQLPIVVHAGQVAGIHELALDCFSSEIPIGLTWATAPSRSAAAVEGASLNGYGSEKTVFETRQDFIWKPAI